MRFAKIGLCALALLTPSLALANGRFPATNQIVVAPQNPDTILLRTTYGLVLSHDHGKTWDWICEQAYSPSRALNGDPPTELMGSGVILVGTPDGLPRSDIGCAWKNDPSLAGQFVSDLVVRSDTPKDALLVTSTYLSGGADGGTLYLDQTWQTQDDGAHWATFGVAIDPSWISETIEVARSDPQRIYVSAARGFNGSREGAIFVSTNAGQSWTLHAFALDVAMETAPFIGAVDPNNADRLYVRTGGAPLIDYPDGGRAAPSSRLFVSDDAGKTFKLVLTAPDQLQGFALSPDGATVFAGSPRLGLMRANTTDFAFKQTSSIHVQCLRATANELWACSDEASGFVVGLSTDQGATFDPRLHLNGLRSVLKCPASTDTAICIQYFEPLCAALTGCNGNSPPDGGKVPPVQPPPGQASNCGCDTSGSSAPAGATLLFSFVISLAQWRRKRRRGNATQEASLGLFGPKSRPA